MVEMIIYVSILSLFTVLIVNTLLIFSKSWASVKVTKNINLSATSALERFTREVRQATSVSGSSVLAVSPGEVTLNTKDASGNPTTIRFYLSGGKLFAQTGSGDSEQLTLSATTVSELTFWKTTVSKSEAIKIKMLITATEGDKTAVEQFDTSVVVRGKYQN